MKHVLKENRGDQLIEIFLFTRFFRYTYLSSSSAHWLSNKSLVRLTQRFTDRPNVLQKKFSSLACNRDPVIPGTGGSSYTSILDAISI